MLYNYEVCFIYDGLEQYDKSIENFSYMIHSVLKKIPVDIKSYVFFPSKDILEKFRLFNKGVVKDNFIKELRNSDNQTTEAYCENILKAMIQIKPKYIFSLSSILGRAITAWLGVKLKTGVVADAVDINFDLKSTHMIYTRATNYDSLLSNVMINTFPEVASLRSKIQGHELNYNLCNLLNLQIASSSNSSKEGRINILKLHNVQRCIGRNKVVIGVGRGVTAEALQVIKKFTYQFNIPLMCSKPLTENGIFPMDRQIGQSGSSIFSDVYIAVGISGATQHLVGTLNCKRIIAINNNPEAVIHKYSDISLLNDAAIVFNTMLSLR